MRLLPRCLGLAVMALLMIGVLSLMVLYSHHKRLVSLHSGDAAIVESDGRKVAVLPRLGSVLDRLRRPADLVVLVYLPTAWLLLAETKHLWRGYARPSYSARLKE